MFNSSAPALVLIDVQLAIDCFSTELSSQPEAESKMASLLMLWRTQQWPVIHVRHSSRHSESPYHASKSTFAFKPDVQPMDTEIIISKRENCAFVDTPLLAELTRLGVSELVIGGVLINHSVDATVRVAAAYGFDVILVNDATAAFGMTLEDGRHVPGELVHQIYATNLHGEYCSLLDTKSIHQRLAS